MMTDTEIKVKGIQILAQYLGDIEMERFMLSHGKYSVYEPREMVF